MRAKLAFVILVALAPGTSPADDLLDRAREALSRGLFDTYRNVRLSCARSLAHVGADAAAVPALCRALPGAPPELAEALADALETAGESARAAVPLLEPALDGPDSPLRRAVLSALRRIDLRVVIAREVRRFRGPPGPARREAAQLLGREGEVGVLVQAARSSPDAALRRDAIDGLWNANGDLPATLISTLLEATRSSDPAMRSAAWGALGKCPPDAGVGWSALEATVTDEHVAFATEAAIVRACPLDAGLLPSLAARLAAARGPLRRALASALARGPSLDGVDLSTLEAMCRDGDDSVRDQGLTALGRVLDRPQAEELLLDLAGDPATRWRALQLLPRVKEHRARAIRLLLDTAAAAEESVSCMALYAADQMKLGATGFVRMIVRNVVRSPPLTGMPGVYEGYVARAPAAYVEELQRVWGGASRSARHVLAWLLEDAASAAGPMLRQLDAMLGEPDLRGFALLVARRLGTQALPLMPHLVRLQLRSGDPDERAVMDALADCAPGEPAVVELLAARMDDASTGWCACEALARMRPLPANRLRQAARDGPPASRLRAAYALALRGVDRDAYVEQLLQALSDPGSATTKDASTALEMLGTGAILHPTELRRLFAWSLPYASWNSVSFSNMSSALPVLVEAVRSPDPAARHRACEELAWSHPDRDTGRIAAALLLGALADPAPETREAAARALGYMLMDPEARDRMRLAGNGSIQ